MKQLQITAIDASVNLNDRTTPEQQKMMIVIFDGWPVETVAELARTAKMAHIPIILAPNRSQTAIPDADQISNLTIIHGDRYPNLGPIKGACHAARRTGVTHLGFVHPVRALGLEDLSTLAAAIQKTPDAVIVGQPEPAPGRDARRTRWGRRLAGVCYRLQTGRQLDDVNSGVCAFPLTVLELLAWSRRPHLFMLQAPVKAVWAGVEVKQAKISSTLDRGRRALSRWGAIGAGMAKGMMRLHLTMRAITPWPHRKIASDRSKPNVKISVFHPMRAIKSLLTENTTPWQLCLATALGVFIGALPLIATHTIAILFAAGYFRLNKVAALTASQLCMPPLVPALCIEAGYYMRFGNFLTEISLKTIGYQAIERLYEWLLGSLLLGPLLAGFAGAIVYLLAVIVRKRLITAPKPGA